MHKDQYKEILKYYLVSLFILSCALYSVYPHGAYAFSEVESVTTFRSDQKSLSLPLLAVYVAADTQQDTTHVNEALKPLLNTTLVMVENQSQAQMTMAFLSNNTVLCTSMVDSSFQKRFTLPQEKELLQQSMVAYAQSLGVRSLQGGAIFEDVVWRVQMWVPAHVGENGVQNIHGELWKPLKDVVTKEKSVTASYQGRTLLSFSFMNNSSENFYAYLLNATNTGQIIPILAPDTLSNAQNTLLMQKKHMVEDVYLELGAPEEQVLFILSREPLALNHWQQENFDGIMQNFLQATTSPSAENWSSRKLIYIQK